MIDEIPKWATTVVVTAVIGSGILFLAGSILEAFV
tara:strand:+ start:2915 stop:3019 length:105 start_codon:yes stop_codon:yes gene_type:complete